MLLPPGDGWSTIYRLRHAKHEYTSFTPPYLSSCVSAACRSFETAIALLKNTCLEQVEAEALIDVVRVILTTGVQAAPPVPAPAVPAPAATANDSSLATNIAAGHDVGRVPVATQSLSTAVDKTGLAGNQTSGNRLSPCRHDECEVPPQTVHDFESTEHGCGESEVAASRGEGQGGDSVAKVASKAVPGYGAEDQARHAMEGRVAELESGCGESAKISAFGHVENPATSSGSASAFEPEEKNKERSTHQSVDRPLASGVDKQKTELSFRESAEASAGVFVLLVCSSGFRV